MASDEGKRYMRGYTWNGLSNAEQEDALALLDQLRKLRVKCQKCTDGKVNTITDGIEESSFTVDCPACSGTDYVPARAKDVDVAVKETRRAGKGYHDVDEFYKE